METMVGNLAQKEIHDMEESVDVVSVYRLFVNLLSQSLFLVVDDSCDFTVHTSALQRSLLKVS